MSAALLLGAARAKKIPLAQQVSQSTFLETAPAEQRYPGFTVVNACPNDPVGVKCCIQSSCSDNSGQCLDIDRSACRDGSFKKGLCPGGANIQCCQKTPFEPENPFIVYLGRLHSLATKYGGDKPANQLVMEWLRHEEYNDFQWRVLIGGVDDDFIAYVKNAGIKTIAWVRDPGYNIDFKVSHLGACMNGVFLKGKASGSSTNRGDVAGWGGDWMTFYGEWRRDVDKEPSGGEYCRDHMCNNVDDTTFKLRDLIEDADCYNIGMRLRASPGLNIAGEFKRNLEYGYKTRMKKFAEGRFGSRAGAQALAKSMLLPGDDVLVNTGRIRLVQQKGGTLVRLPLWLSYEDMDDLTGGFADRLYTLVSEEAARN